jgi:predicted type IV restriction endonuclease
MPLAQTYQDARAQVEQLVEQFHRNLDAYKRPEYKETQVRVEFIDPFFEALGWDVRNSKGRAEQYKDVVHEEALKVAGATRAPDYCFRISGTRRFFLEAKRPSVAIKGDVRPAYQLRRYAWSAKLALSIVTDFDDSAGAARHDRLVALVEQMVDLHERLAAAIPDDRARIQRQIEVTDQAVDALVYELHGLTEEEIAIVERAT